MLLYLCSLIPYLLQVVLACGLEVIAASENWLDGKKFRIFVLSDLQKLQQQAKKCIDLRGECVE